MTFPVTLPPNFGDTAKDVADVDKLFGYTPDDALRIRTAAYAFGTVVKHHTRKTVGQRFVLRIIAQAMLLALRLTADGSKPERP
jgi:hypothetical protein